MLKSKLTKRIIFSIIFLIVALPGLIISYYGQLPGKIIGLIMLGSIGILGLYEILTTMGVNKYISILSSFLLVLMIILPWQNFLNTIKFSVPKNKNHLSYYLRINILTWENFLIISLISVLPIIIDNKFRSEKNYVLKQIIIWLATFIAANFIKAAWIIAMHNIVYVIFFICIAIISDTFAYFGGMIFGKKLFKGKKFAPKISPKKTWGGFMIGFIFTLIFAIIGGYYMRVWKEYGQHELLVAFFYGILLALIAPYGDLLFSFFKRVANKKDFSKLIPGHGGVFDRLDAMSVIVVCGAFFIGFAAFY